MKRYRPKPPRTPPLPDNPYRRFFTAMPDLNALARPAPAREKAARVPPAPRIAAPGPGRAAPDAAPSQPPGKP